MDMPKTNLFKKLFQSPESRFILGVALKVWSISFVAELIVGYILYTNVRLNFFFFRAHGYAGIDELQSAYFDYVLSDTVDFIPYILFFHVTVFFTGLYIGYLMLRPFRRMGRYCTISIQDADVPYKVEEFSSYRLLTRFSEFFFDFINESRRKGKLEAREVPTNYMGIHGPVFDGVFLLHFALFLIMIVIFSVLVTMHFASEIHLNTIQIAIKMLKANPEMIRSFFNDQSFMINEMWYLTAVIVISLHVVMGLHLYNQVSGAAFGIFATMRSFLKGNFQSRIHLVGYSYLRESTRSINKYLDWISKNLPH